MAALHIRLFGGFEARLGSGEVLPLKGRKTQALVAYLALAPGEQRTRDELVALLWGDRGEPQARSSLRQSLSELRKALGDAGDSLLIAGRDAVSLDAVDVDVTEFGRLIDDGTPAALEQAAELYRGDLLDGIGIREPAFEDWLRDARQRLHGQVCEALSRLLDHQAAGDAERAIATARRLLALDPLREVTHRVLMRLYAGKGERTLALKQYQACRDVLTADLGVTPEAETERLAEEIRNGGNTMEAREPGPAPETMEPPEALPLPDKPSIAVLPFVNLSDDPGQIYFSDGLTEDIITELSRFKSLDVVARNSTFVYRDQAVNVSEIGEKVGASHLLEGSVRKSGNRIRLTAQLIDVKTGKHIWGDRYDRELEDIFALQDELVHSIVSALAVRLSAADTERSLRKPAISLAAYDLYLRAVNLDRLYNVDKAREAKELASQAVALDPGFARAYTVLSTQIYTCGWFENIPRDNYLDEALRAAAKAVELDPNDSFCLSNLGTVHLQRREYDQARHFVELALKSNPNDTEVWADYAWYLTSVGKSEEALERLDSRENFEPFPPNWHWEIRGQVLYMLKRYGEARTSFERMTVTPFWAKGFLAACCGQLGEVEAARRYWADALESAPPKGDPTVFMSDAYRDIADVEHWADGLRKAGLTE